VEPQNGKKRNEEKEQEPYTHFLEGIMNDKLKERPNETIGIGEGSP